MFFFTKTIDLRRKCLQWFRAIQDRHTAAKDLAEDKLEEMGALDQEQASEEDIRATEDFLARMLAKLISFQIKMVENMPQPEQAAGIQAGQEEEAVRAAPERKVVRLDPQSILMFHHSEHTMP